MTNYASAISLQDPPERTGLPSAIDPSVVGVEPPAATLAREPIFSIESLTAFYGDAPAIRDVSFEIYQRMVTAIIGPSGCGKSTFIRCLNRMNDLIPNFKTEGRILYRDVDLQAKNVDPSAATADRDGLPASEPVSEVDLRQRRVRPASRSGSSEDLDGGSRRR